MRLRVLSLAAGLLGTLVSAPQTPAPNAARPTNVAERHAAWTAHLQLAVQSPFAPLAWRALGPEHQSERIEAIAVPAGSRNTIYVGPGAGNVWKTTNNGLTWTPIFDHESAFAVGDIAVAPSNDQIVWVGTGEVQPRFAGYAFAGTGVFKSTDAGRTWKNMGLADSQHIGKILIDPSNPDVVYVGAMGHQWTPNAERGVFKTTDGGQHWSKVLFLDNLTGAIDLAMDPSNHDVLYASMWQIETGPKSGLYRSTDGGATWTRLTNGLPAQIGRSNLAVAPSHPQTVYTFLDNRAPFTGGRDRTYVGGEVYRSDDRGETWHKANTEDLWPVFTIYGWKFCDVRVSPDNPDEIYILGNKGYHSTDGGRTYSLIGETIRRLRDTQGLVLHLDQHELWIDPTDPNHLLLGNDGGVFS
ncbi:MAG: WD40/YVTN/BNR-like repeat-containing protein, partial [Vicinamibacterales bacterium]